MPGETGVTVVTTLVCSFYFACEAAGASSARHSLRPLIGGREIHRNLGRIKPRDRKAVSQRHCEEQSDEAIHSFFLLYGLLRFARNDVGVGCLKIESPHTSLRLRNASRSN